MIEPSFPVIQMVPLLLDSSFSEVSCINSILDVYVIILVLTPNLAICETLSESLKFLKLSVNLCISRIKIRLLREPCEDGARIKDREESCILLDVTNEFYTSQDNQFQLLDSPSLGTYSQEVKHLKSSP